MYSKKTKKLKIFSIFVFILINLFVSSHYYDRKNKVQKKKKLIMKI